MKPPSQKNAKESATLESEPEPPVSIARTVCSVLVDRRNIARYHMLFIVASSDNNVDA